VVNAWRQNSDHKSIDIKIVRAFCFACGKYGPCAVGWTLSMKEVFVGIDCGCFEKDVERIKKLRAEGSPHVPYV
jgi:hypothetical protein